MNKRAVIALGGNALGITPNEQKQKISKAAVHIVELISQGYEVVISHGNGPQVGMINLAFCKSSEQNSKILQVELAECTAMSQGYIGYHLQDGIQSELKKQGMPWKAVTVVTQIEVSPDDPAFLNPVKPIGPYYTKDQADRMSADNPKNSFIEDAGRGYRRAVASPRPVYIVEKDAILKLLENEFVVIACGGGGIPVVKKSDGKYEGISAVIDKDFASARLAELVGADYLLILTSVDRVSIYWGKPEQKEIMRMTDKEAEKYCIEGQFAPGSMLPKVEAAISFVRSGNSKKSVICSLDKALLAVKGLSGTEIIRE